MQSQKFNKKLMIGWTMDKHFKAFVQDMFMKHKDECRWWKLKCKYGSYVKYYKQNRNFLKTKYKENKSEQKR